MAPPDDKKPRSNHSHLQFSYSAQPCFISFIKKKATIPCFKWCSPSGINGVIISPRPKAGFAPPKGTWYIFEAHGNGNCCCQGWCPRNVSWEIPSVGGIRYRRQHRNKDFKFLSLVVFMELILKHWSNGPLMQSKNHSTGNHISSQANQDQHES